MSHFQALRRESRFLFACLYARLCGSITLGSHLSNKTIDGEPAPRQALYLWRARWTWAATDLCKSPFLTHKCTSIWRTHKKFHGRKTIWIKLSHQAFSYSFPVCVALIGDEPREKIHLVSHLISLLHWLRFDTLCFALSERDSRGLICLFCHPPRWSNDISLLKSL